MLLVLTRTGLPLTRTGLPLMINTLHTLYLCQFKKIIQENLSRDQDKEGIYNIKVKSLLISELYLKRRRGINPLVPPTPYPKIT